MCHAAAAVPAWRGSHSRTRSRTRIALPPSSAVHHGVHGHEIVPDGGKRRGWALRRIHSVADLDDVLLGCLQDGCQGQQLCESSTAAHLRLQDSVVNGASDLGSLVSRGKRSELGTIQPHALADVREQVGPIKGHVAGAQHIVEMRDYMTHDARHVARRVETG